MICAWIETSSADTGSSSTMSFGSTASARAMPMRWRWPPENSCGKRLTCSGARPTRSSSSLHAALDVGLVRPPCAASATPTIWPIALARVQRRVRVLEDHLHLAPQRHELLARACVTSVAAEAQRAAGRLEQPHDRARQRRLAAARLADEAERLALVQGERDVVDGMHVTDDAVDEDRPA